MKLLVPCKIIQAHLTRVVEALSHMEGKVGVVSASGVVAQGGLGPRGQSSNVVKIKRPSWYARSFGTETRIRAYKSESQLADVQAAQRSVGAVDGRQSLPSVKQNSDMVMPVLRAGGIGRRWVEALDREHKRKSSVGMRMSLTADDRSGGVGRLVAQASRIKGSITNSWVCPLCRTIVPDMNGTQQRCVIVRCSGVKPGTGKARLGTATMVEGVKGIGVGVDKEAAMLQLLDEIFVDGVCRKKDAKQKGPATTKARDRLGWWGLCVLSVVGALLLLLACGGLLKTMATSRSDKQYPLLPMVSVGTLSDVNLTLSTKRYENALVSLGKTPTTVHETEGETKFQMEEEEEIEEEDIKEEMEEEEMDDDDEEEEEEESNHPFVGAGEVKSSGDVDSAADDITRASFEVDDIVTVGKAEVVVKPDTRPSRSKPHRAWGARLVGWRDRHQKEAAAFLTGPWC